MNMLQNGKIFESVSSMTITVENLNPLSRSPQSVESTFHHFAKN